jgi:hypothetical protein
VRWWLLPSGRLSAADRLAATSEAAQTSSIIAATDAARMIKAIDAQLEEALAKDNPVDVVDSATAKLRSRRAQLIARGAVVDQFAHIAGTSAWHRGVMGARAATLLALPWIVLSIRADARQILSGGYHYRVGQFLTAATFDVLWWSGVGFVLGSAYPAIRGSNGLQKASALLATIAVPAFVTLLFPGPATHHHLVATIQTAAESASVLLVLGLLGDYFLLRRAGFGYRKLIETRRLSAVVTWATSLTVAIGAAVTSLLVAGVTGALTYLSTPNVQRPNSGSGSGTSQLVK